MVILLQGCLGAAALRTVKTERRIWVLAQLRYQWGWKEVAKTYGLGSILSHGSVEVWEEDIQMCLEKQVGFPE